MRAPHLTTIAAALMTVGGALWGDAMADSPAAVPGGVICGLHPAMKGKIEELMEVVSRADR